MTKKQLYDAMIAMLDKHRLTGNERKIIANSIVHRVFTLIAQDKKRKS